MKHYTDHPTFLGAFIAFNRLAREEGLAIGIGESIEALSPHLLSLWSEDRTLFKTALTTLYCGSKEDLEQFYSIYHYFWEARGSRQKSKIVSKTPSKKRTSSLVMLGTGDNVQETEHKSKTTSGAQNMESLRHTDFSIISDIEDPALRMLCDQLVKEMSLRIRRKEKSGKKDRLDIRRTIRNNMQHGGDLIRLYHKEKKKEKLKLVILLDVSGSMDKYSFYLLRFIWTLRNHFKQIEAFTFSTRLLRITPILHEKDLDRSLQNLSFVAKHWSGGTRIGECLRRFNQKYGKKILSGRSMTIILSDGLDTGDPEVLNQALQKIRGRTKTLVWLNPLKGMEGYEPIQKGMQAALPNLDIFQSAHNLNSLLKLEKIIAHA